MFNARRFLRDLHFAPYELEILCKAESGEQLNDFEAQMVDALDGRIFGLITDWAGCDE